MSDFRADPPTRDEAQSDPRLRPADPAQPIDVGDGLRPAVASPRRPPGAALIVAGATGLGVLVFLFLSSHRGAGDVSRNAAGASTLATQAPSSSTPPPELLAAEAAARAPAAAPPPTFVLPTPVAAPPLLAPAPPVITPTPAPTNLVARRNAPALVVDLSDAAAAGQGGKAAPPVVGSAPVPARLSADEQFAERLSGSAEPERARATMLRNPSATVAQGTVIPAVLETALNSDLPGFARAVVSRDVRGFDGSTVLIPRGARLVGEYKSGVALGASRAFVVWTRLLRPDGASIQIGSPGTDELGRAGLAGSVDRHFFQRYSGAILLSAVNAGVTALTRGPSTSVVIGSSSDAAGLGALVQPTTISPTIKVPQGATIRIFVAKDLDFSTVRNPTEPRP